MHEVPQAGDRLFWHADLPEVQDDDGECDGAAAPHF